jgi:hypothetical protein
VIIGSIALIALAAGLWLAGLSDSSDVWFYASIVVSAIAALMLIAGVRRRARAVIPEDDFDVDRLHPVPGSVPRAPRPTGRATVPTGRRPAELAEAPSVEPPWRSAAVEVPAEEPPDEPPAEILTDRQARRVAAMTADVVVIDGRPRYHDAGCLHLLGREAERVPVDEAVQLGFTPCGQCEPVRGLLATSPRG